MRALLTLLLLAASPAVALDDVVLRYDELPPPPPDDIGHISIVDLPEAVLVRPSTRAFGGGLDYDLINEVVLRVLSDREHSYDFAVVTHTSRLPHSFDAGAFHLAYNNAELAGLGQDTQVTPSMPVRSLLWMNHLDYWDTSAPYTPWVFAHEVSHYWLAHPKLADDHRYDLLGRQTAHWSWFVHTPNSPMEGNAWVDNGDGTFTTDVSVPSEFSPLDLYLMGLAPASEVPDFFYIDDPIGTSKLKASRPQHLVQGWEDAETVRGTRVDVSIDDIIAVNGERRPSMQDSPTHFRMLPILILAPGEMLREQDLAKLRELQSLWTQAWNDLTLGRSTCSFNIDEDRQPPPMLAPTTVPKGSW